MNQSFYVCSIYMCVCFQLHDMNAYIYDWEWIIHGVLSTIWLILKGVVEIGHSVSSVLTALTMRIQTNSSMELLSWPKIPPIIFIYIFCCCCRCRVYMFAYLCVRFPPPFHVQICNICTFSFVFYFKFPRIETNFVANCFMKWFSTALFCSFCSFANGLVF